MQQGQLNPYLEASFAEAKKKENLDTRRHKFIVHGLYMPEKPIQEEAYDLARKYCKENHIDFVLRDFYNGMVEDRECVEHLPAFHVYYEEEYMKTFYEADELEGILQKIIEELKAEKKNTWMKRFMSMSLDVKMPRFSLPSIRRNNRILSSSEKMQ